MPIKRKPSIKSRRQAALADVADNVLRAVMCEARTVDSIAELSGEPRSHIERALAHLEGRRLILKTDAGYVPARILKRAG